ncbi:MAG: carboxypeptidase-like regulatory domain-containing protein, partial [Acidobacteriota bacterium]
MGLGQTTATLNGTIHDPSGGIVQGAEVLVTQTATGLVRQVLTNGVGLFRIPAIPVGEVEVRITAKGFRPMVRRGISLSVNESATIDVTLEVGAVDQEVTVNASASQVNTSTSELGYLVSESAMRELPLNGRNYT